MLAFRKVKKHEMQSGCDFRSSTLPHRDVGGLTAADPLPMDTPSRSMASTRLYGHRRLERRSAVKAYPVRIEFSNGGAQYLAGAHVNSRRARHS